MEEDILTMYDQVIRSDLRAIDHLALGSDDRGNAIADLEKLHKMRMEEEKLRTSKVETFDRNDEKEKERATKERELRIQKFATIAQACAQIGIPLLTLFAYGHWFRMGLHHEDEGGVIGNAWTKNLIGKMLPSKK